MTTIAAIQGDGWAVIGHDSRVSELNTGGRFFSLPSVTPKVVEIGDYLIGCAGDLRALNVVAHALKPPAAPGRNLDKFITSTFIPHLKQTFDEHGIGTKESSPDVNLMVVVRGVVYEIGDSYEWCRDVSGVYSIGSGSAYALGSMITSKGLKDFTQQTAKRAVRKGIEVASQLDWGTAPPIVLYTQEA